MQVRSVSEVTCVLCSRVAVQVLFTINFKILFFTFVVRTISIYEINISDSMISDSRFFEQVMGFKIRSLNSYLDLILIGHSNPKIAIDFKCFSGLMLLSVRCVD